MVGSSTVSLQFEGVPLLGSAWGSCCGGLGHSQGTGYLQPSDIWDGRLDHRIVLVRQHSEVWTGQPQASDCRCAEEHNRGGGQEECIWDRWLLLVLCLRNQVQTLLPLPPANLIPPALRTQTSVARQSLRRTERFFRTTSELYTGLCTLRGLAAQQYEDIPGQYLSPA